MFKLCFSNECSIFLNGPVTLGAPFFYQEILQKICTYNYYKTISIPYCDTLKIVTVTMAISWYFNKMNHLISFSAVRESLNKSSLVMVFHRGSISFLVFYIMKSFKYYKIWKHQMSISRWFTSTNYIFRTITRKM